MAKPQKKQAPAKPAPKIAFLSVVAAALGAEQYQVTFGRRSTGAGQVEGWSCTCPDFHHRRSAPGGGHCKHITEVRAQLALVLVRAA